MGKTKIEDRFAGRDINWLAHRLEQARTLLRGCRCFLRSDDYVGEDEMDEMLKDIKIWLRSIGE